ncbi:hypothetical protein NLX83_01790 [Allokutzneria sp. A3M-2-11 16]|uniref:hypothetical protein n=1 Tax=Allokutzneria sp. A3M-2-11 16 TaxID=2962043 RepID=UPI0020B8328B|nr:hypothetical protein [Allokutzneria sp. A3M-2-11 16]MCP3797981.1 hypothetical protein [Allokutzneria sp. A3M-2-11 16]
MSPVRPGTAELVEELRAVLWNLADPEDEQQLVHEAAEEPLLRCAGALFVLLLKHLPEDGEQCPVCPRWQRTGLWWRRSTRCSVRTAARFFLTKPMDVVWWQLLARLQAPEQIELEEVRSWLNARAAYRREQGLDGEGGEVHRSGGGVRADEAETEVLPRLGE